MPMRSLPARGRNAIVVVLGINERDHGSLYNAQLIFDADGTHHRSSDARSRPPSMSA